MLWNYSLMVPYIRFSDVPGHKALHSMPNTVYLLVPTAWPLAFTRHQAHQILTPCDGGGGTVFFSNILCLFGLMIVVYRGILLTYLRPFISFDGGWGWTACLPSQRTGVPNTVKQRETFMSNAALSVGSDLYELTTHEELRVGCKYSSTHKAPPLEE